MLQYTLLVILAIIIILGVRVWFRQRRVYPEGGVMLSGATAGGIIPKLWPFPAVVTSAFMLAWATEVAQFFISRGMAIAILAFLEVLPEFSVEATITYHAVYDPDEWMPMVTANFTGANRLLVGLGIPLVFFLASYFHLKERKRLLSGVHLEKEGSIEVIFLLLPTLYSFLIVAKGTLNLADTLVLGGMYAIYLYILYHLPPEEEEEPPGIPGMVRKRSRGIQIGFMLCMFILGGTILYLSIDPFVENTAEIAILLFGAGSTYFFFQWVAPLLSESPELLTVSYWVKRGKLSSGLLNVISSKINQWTLLIAMIPAIFTILSLIQFGGVRELHFDSHQRVEVLLTAAQSLFISVCLLKMRVVAWEFITLFMLWFIQLFDPVMDPALHDLGMVSIFGTGAYIRELFILIYLSIAIADLIMYRKELTVIKHLRETIRLHVYTRGSRSR